MSSEFEAARMPAAREERRDEPSSGQPVPRPSRPERLPLLRAMEIGELLDETFDLYKRNFRLFFGITVLISAPLSLVPIAFVNDPNAVWYAFLDSSLMIVLTSGIVILAGRERLLGRPITIVAAFRASQRPYLRLFLGLVAWLALTGLIEGVCLLPALLLQGVSQDVAAAVGALGFLFSLIPLTLPLLWSMLLIPVAMLEKQGLGALGRCRRLAAGNTWRLAVYSLGAFALVLIVSLVAVSLMALVIPFIGIKPFETSGSGNTISLVAYSTVMVLNSAVESAWMPIIGIVSLLIYIDFRIRREAYDLELLTGAVEARVTAERGPASSPLLSGGSSE